MERSSDLVERSQTLRVLSAEPVTSMLGIEGEIASAETGEECAESVNSGVDRDRASYDKTRPDSSDTKNSDGE